MKMNCLWKNMWLCLFVSAVVLGFSLSTMAADSIVVGVLHREDFAYAAMMRTAFDMALEEINNAKGINDQIVELVFADDRGDAKAGERAVRELVLEKKAVLLVGGYSSSNTLTMAYTANRLNIPFLVCTAADDRITQHKLKNIYRLNPPVSEYTKGLEEFLLEHVKPKSMSIVYENSPFGTGSAMRMMWFCRENDIAIKAIQPYFKDGAKSEYIQRILTPIQNDPPEVLFMSSYLKDAVLLVRKVSELNIKTILCGGAGGFTHDDFPRQTEKTSEYLLTATLWAPSSANDQENNFSQRFFKRHGKKPDYHAVEAYSVMMVASTALKKTTSLEPSAIRSAIESTRRETPFGVVSFKDYGPFQRQNVSDTPVLQIINNKYETVWPKKLKTAEFIKPPLQ
jgi:branched-chain amino acid transport system substrate-binding protein